MAVSHSKWRNCLFVGWKSVVKEKNYLSRERFEPTTVWGNGLVPRRVTPKLGVKQIRHFWQTSPKLIWILAWCWVCKRMIHLVQDMIKLTCPSHQSIGPVVKTKPCTDKTATVACYLNLAEKPAGLGDVFLETIESMSATKSMMIFQVALEQNRNSKR